MLQTARLGHEHGGCSSPGRLADDFGLLRRERVDCRALEEQVASGACGLKLHEDGTTRRVDACLAVADRFDVQVAITPTPSTTSGSSVKTIAAIAGERSTVSHRGAGAAHARTSSASLRSRTCCLSTNPTPPDRNTIAEHLRC